ncbi:MAG: hypothetical protein LDL09_04410 [Calditerrivibrio sp.]|nr:hypothetical protein [Calditerrivibrio sp.]
MNSIDFIDKICRDIEKLLDEGDLEKADEGITNIFSRYGDKIHLLKKFNKLLGKYNFLKGDRLKSLEYFTEYIKDSPEDIDAVLYMAETLLDMGRDLEAFPYITKIMNREELFTRGRFFYLLYLIGIDNAENGYAIFKELHSANCLNVNDYIKVSYYFLLKKKFDLARDVILCGLNGFKGSNSLQDEYEYALHIENYYKENLKKYYFGNLDKFEFKTDIYSKSLRLITEGLSIRNYNEYEIALSIELLRKLNRNKFSATYNMIAAICDYFIIHLFLEEWEISYVIEKFYDVKIASVKKHFLYLDNQGFFNEFYDNLENILKINIEEDYDE